MAVTLTVAELVAALRLGDSVEEHAEVTRLLSYCTEAVTQHAPEASDTAMNEAVRRLSGYLFDQPEASRSDGYANALRSSGASRMLLPYRVHRAGLTDAVAEAQAAVGTADNPVADVDIVGGELVITFADGSTESHTLPAQDPADQTARDAIESHEASPHNTDVVARSTARNARQVGEQAQTTIEAHERTPHGGSRGVDQTARDSAAAAQSEIDAHEVTAHNRDTVARSTARNARQVGEQAQTTIEAHEATPHNTDQVARDSAAAAQATADAAVAPAARVELYRDTEDYRRTSSSTIFRQFALSRAPVRGRGLELVIATRNWRAPFYFGTDDWLDMTLTAQQLNGVISAGTVPVSATIPIKSIAFDESNSNSFGHGIVYVGRVSDVRMAIRLRGTPRDGDTDAIYRQGDSLVPADRRITINVTSEGHRDERGEYVPGAVTALGVWARRRDVSQESKVERGGTRGETSRDWRVRWDSRIASSTTANLKVEDGGETFNIINLVEVTQQRRGPDLRRRWLDLTGIRSSS